MAKPIVDGLERELQGTAQVIRINVVSDMGRRIAGAYGINAMPTLLVFNGQGTIVFQQVGPPSKTRVLEAVAGAIQ